MREVQRQISPWLVKAAAAAREAKCDRGEGWSGVGTKASEKRRRGFLPPSSRERCFPVWEGG